MEGVIRYVPTVSAPSSVPVTRASNKQVTAFLALVNKQHNLHCILRSHFYTDVNECGTGNGGCGQICTNSVGSFQCSCNQGFQLASDGFSCNGKCAIMVSYAVCYVILKQM